MQEVCQTKNRIVKVAKCMYSSMGVIFLLKRKIKAVKKSQTVILTFNVTTCIKFNLPQLIWW